MTNIIAQAEALTEVFTKLQEDEWLMKKFKHSYIVYSAHDIASTSILRSKLLVDLPFILETKDPDPDYDCLVYSLTYQRYSFNRLAYLAQSPINIHECTDLDEFNSLVAAHRLGTDLSFLWGLV